MMVTNPRDIEKGSPPHSPRVSQEDFDQLRAMVERSNKRLARAREIAKELGLEDIL